MDFIDELKQFSNRVAQLQQHIMTEEATKTSFIMPFFQLLGYDVFNPSEFIPEFTADFGIKKGEKVDYAIMQDDKPMILIEAKWSGEKLQKHDSQLFRYFGTTTAKFAILTNGIDYWFYTDLEEQNKMDEKPFLELNLFDIKESIVPELKKFQKSNFDLETIFNSASELKYANQIKQFMSQQLSTPSDAFISYVIGEILPGRKKTQGVIEKFRDTVKKSLNQFVNELMNDRIKSALDTQPNSTTEQPIKTEEPIIIEVTNKMVTTEEELEGFFIVKSLLRDYLVNNKLTYKDTESYFGILLDNNTRKWICRLQLSSTQKSIIFPDETKRGQKHLINGIEDIYNFKKELTDIIEKYQAS